ncbi:hypothetical protein QU481_11025 [Crenobacter sp. SG2303]|uniref:Uncharacterized protein n=1 Tax=Crenobacter oryzisoli TaxID=3056844 RepID=A0ABT7XNP7_9NEIS|nr:hypothetical protein [Crenobacter sp. SG2303]MDN0075423.1 hypothetical protein [Crenobacter sp. SG2303]
MREHACYADKSLSEKAGVLDFMGLAPVNERLIEHCLPGINGTVSMLRVYAALCWMAWRVTESLTASDTDGPSVSRLALQKMDLVLMWSMQGSGYTGLVGGQRQFPVDSQEATFIFDAFPDSQAAYFTPVQYRPSIVNGLELLQAGAGGSYRCTAKGRKLAEALDEVLKNQYSADDYAWLADVRQLKGTGANAKAFQSLLTSAISEAEQQAFLEAFMPSGPEVDAYDARRAATSRLMLRCLSRSKDGLSVPQLRATLARGVDQQGRPLVDDDKTGESTILRAQAVLQVRQLQRFALEWCMVLFVAFVRREFPRELPVPLKTQIQLFLDEGLSAEALSAAGSTLGIDADLAKLKQLQGDAPTLSRAALTNPDVPLLDIDNLSQGKKPEPTFLANLYQALLRCKVETENLLAMDVAYTKVMQAEGARIPLTLLSRAVDTFRSQSPKDFMAYVLEVFCVNQQLHTAASRTRGPFDTNRYMLAMGEMGWEATSTKVPNINPSPDRLRNTCLLLKDCGLLQAKGEKWLLTEQAHPYIEHTGTGA